MNSATDIFAFQGSHTRVPHQNQVPDIIRDWPTLVSDPLLASICPPAHQSGTDGAISDEPDITNKDSLLVVADNDGNLSLYQDGAFPLGRIHVGKGFFTRSLYSITSSPSTFFVHVAKPVSVSELTPLCGVRVDVPLMRRRFCRELAQLSSSARDLTWYAMRVVKEMRSIWFNTDTSSGAREWGPRWVRSLETKQREQYGRKLNPVVTDKSVLNILERTNLRLSSI
jgi:anaphase-promoting complex subunit 4